MDSKYSLYQWQCFFSYGQLFVTFVQPSKRYAYYAGMPACIWQQHLQTANDY